MDWADLRDEFIALVHDAKAIATGTGLSESVAKLDELSAEATAFRFRVFVVGRFKAGKSTLINALVRSDSLPRRDNPATGLITTVGWSLEPKYFLLPRNARVQVEVGPSDWNSAVLVDSQNENSPYQAATYLAPLSLCEDGVEFVDTPGLEEDPEREALTLDGLPLADAVLWVTTAIGGFSQEELGFLRNRIAPLKLRDALFIVVNKFDAVNDVIEVRNRCLMLASPSVVSAEDRVFFTSAVRAIPSIERKTSPRATRLQSSGVPQLEAALTRYLSERRVPHKAGRLLRNLREVVTRSLYMSLSDQRALLNREVGELRADLALYNDQKARLSGEIDSIQDKLNELNRSTVKGATRLLKAWFGEVEQQLPRYVEEIRAEHQSTIVVLVQGTERAHYFHSQLLRRLDASFREWSQSKLEPYLVDRRTENHRNLLRMLETYIAKYEQLRQRITLGDKTTRQRIRKTLTPLPSVDDQPADDLEQLLAVSLVGKPTYLVLSLGVPAALIGVLSTIGVPGTIIAIATSIFGGPLLGAQLARKADKAIANEVVSRLQMQLRKAYEQELVPGVRRYLEVEEAALAQVLRGMLDRLGKDMEVASQELGEGERARKEREALCVQSLEALNNLFARIADLEHAVEGGSSS
jgi:hypothetical protein